MKKDNPVLENAPDNGGIRSKIHEIIFGHHTKSGLGFDLLLLAAIGISVVIVCLETVETFDTFKQSFLIAEVCFTILFALEYGVRVWCVKDAKRYIFSFFGIVDLLAVLPSLIGLGIYCAGLSTGDEIMSGTGSYAVIRSLRLLRVFRLLRIGKLEQESGELAEAIWKARTKVVVFLLSVMITVVIAGTLMYEIEAIGALQASAESGEKIESQFKSIPEGIYWAIVTMTTVGYGDIVPQTIVGKIVSSVLILIGYSLIIVPTGFVSAEVVGQRNVRLNMQLACSSCKHPGHEKDAKFCKVCGAELPATKPS